MTPEEIAEIKNRDIDSLSADAPHNPDAWTLAKDRDDLLAEVERLTEELESRPQARVGDYGGEAERLRNRIRDAYLRTGQRRDSLQRNLGWGDDPEVQARLDEVEDTAVMLRTVMGGAL